jgi:uncharacterized membrane protein
MPRTLILALTALPILFIFDFVWIGVIANGFYRSQLGSLYAPNTVWQVAIVFYILYALGIAYFVIAPAVRTHSLKSVVLNAAFFGLIAYGTYDLTNLATITNWPVPMTFVDMVWGAVSATVVSYFTYLIAVKVYKF